MVSIPLTFVMSKALWYLICKIRNEIQANFISYLKSGLQWTREDVYFYDKM